jgi:cytochrome c553
MKTVFVLAAWLFAATAWSAPGTRKPAPPPAPTDANLVQQLHMHHSFDLLRAIERLLIWGKLDDAKRFATTISMVPDVPAHGPLAAAVVAVRDRASALANATAVDQACRLEAKLVAACADCHVESGVAPAYETFPAAPPDKPTIEARMARHRWAVDRLWEGALLGADAPWRAGLDVLAAAPLDWGARSADRAKLARDLQLLADQARKRGSGDTRETRATSYGEILVTCATCHATKPVASAPTR